MNKLRKSIMRKQFVFNTLWPKQGGRAHTTDHVHTPANPARAHARPSPHPRRTRLDVDGHRRHHDGRPHGQPRARHLRRRPRTGPLQHPRLRHRRHPPRPRHLHLAVPRRGQVRRGQPLAPARPRPRRRTCSRLHDPHRPLAHRIDPPAHRPPPPPRPPFLPPPPHLAT